MDSNNNIVLWPNYEGTLSEGPLNDMKRPLNDMSHALFRHTVYNISKWIPTPTKVSTPMIDKVENNFPDFFGHDN